ncbi:MAG: hypothetical protein U1F43_13655 [Myxococcota bacterium]
MEGGPSDPVGQIGRRALRSRSALSWLALVALALATLTFVVLSAAAASPPAPSPASASYRVIVHPSAAVQSLDRRFLADVFLKKTTRWSGGDAIQPVDLQPAARTRARFSEDVVGRSVPSVKSYWQQIIFSGRGLPPPELPDDDAVVGYVLSHAGAIGYVSGSCDVGAARVVTVR